MLRKFKFILSKQNMKTIYFTDILPLLEYACELWDGVFNKSIIKLHKFSMRLPEL
jgi:hypothetical protein